MEEKRDPKIGVHQRHCCKWHGCKYGEDDCPVVNDDAKQDHPCEWCSEENFDKVLEEIISFCHEEIGITYDECLRIANKSIEIFRNNIR